IVWLGKFARKGRPPRLAGLSIAGSVLFFIVTNFANWIQFDTYPHTPVGLALCYTAAVPWFWNTLAADLLGTGFLFGLDALARRRIGARAAVLALLLSAVAAVLPAQSQSSVSESIIVTATAAPAAQADIGSATTIIARLEIERRGFQTVADALRSVPGLDLVQSGDSGAIASVFMRGSNSNHALLLIDGVRMNSPYFAGY